MKIISAKSITFIIVILAIYIVPKSLRHFNFIKYYGIELKAIESINITSYLSDIPSKFVGIKIDSSEMYNFKDLVLSCNFKGGSNTSIEVVEYPTYQIFENSPLYEFKLNMKYPNQAKSVNCEAVSLIVTSEKSCFKGLNENGELIDKGCKMMSIPK